MYKPIKFTATIEIIGINPFVYLPPDVLEYIFEQAGQRKGKIPVSMWIDGHAFIQTLVRYSGHWRLYLNAPMRKAAQKELGDTAHFEIAFDPQERTIAPHPKFEKALLENTEAKAIFEALRPSLKLEIVRYLSFLKTEESIDKNVHRAINFLLGKQAFIGREKP